MYIAGLTSFLADMICEPSRPEGPLVISDVGFDSAHLSWKPPAEDNGGPILGYIVEAKDILHADVGITLVFWYILSTLALRL